MRLASTLALLAACASASHPGRSPEAPSSGGAPSSAKYFAVPLQVGDLIDDGNSFTTFVIPVRHEAEAAIRTRGDAGAKDALFVLAMLDALDDHWPAAVAELDRIRAVETDPTKAAMTGFTIRVGADARAHGGTITDADVYSSALERQLAALPIARVRTELAMLRAMARTFTPDVCRGLVEDAVGPHARGGAVDFSDAQTIVFQRYAALDLSPVGPTIDRVLAAHGIELPAGNG